MSQEMGLTEFFAMEAGEYLERLDAVVSGPAGPDREEFLRLARALRGSALMANQQSISSVAAALEGYARAVREERVEWDEGAKQTAIRAVDDMKILVRRAAVWGEQEEAKAAAAAQELTAASGAVEYARPRQSEPGVDTGTRAFVAREGAAVAGALNQAARGLQREGLAEQHLESVLKAMQPLRGLAVLPELSPLPEYMDGVERAIAVANRASVQPNDLALFLDLAARGLSQAAKEITGTGRARPDSPEAHEFARRLGAFLDIGGDVIPIQSLYYDDEGPHIIEAGTQAAVPSRMVQLELVAHGEHLVQAADELEHAQYDTQRELRALALTSTLRTLGSAGGSPLADNVARFAVAAREAIASGAPVSQTESFAAQLRKAGAILRATPQRDEGMLAGRLRQVTAELRTLPAVPEAAPAGTSEAGGPLRRPAAPSAAIPSEPPEPEAAPEPVEAVVQPAVPARPAAEPVSAPPPLSEGPADLAASWAEYERLRGELGEGEPSLNELLSAPTGAVPAAPAPAAEVEQEIISINELCYSGPAALKEALCVRDRIREVLSKSEWDRPLITDLIDELLDLVELSIGQ